MSPINDYSVVIFDCDGVVLNSNEMKCEVMRESLLRMDVTPAGATQCIDSFKQNFGTSRASHASRFKDILQISSNSFEKKLLDIYGFLLSEYYYQTQLTDGFEEYVLNLNVQKFVASGSDEIELRALFLKKELNDFFLNIYGAPTKKVDIVASIISQAKGKVLMIGDAKSDLLAAKENKIDFCFYRPLSMVEKEMTNLCLDDNHKIIDHWSELC